MKSSKILRALLFCISSIFCISQIIMVTNDYLKYDVTTEIQISYPDILEIPDISLCLHYVNFINYTAFFVQQPTIFKRMVKQFPYVNNAKNFSEWKFSAHAMDFLIHEFSTLKVKELMSLLIQSDELIKGIYPVILQEEIISSKNITSGCYYETYLKEPTICIVICCSGLQAHKLQLQDLVLSKLSGTMLGIKLEQEIFFTNEEYYIYLHPPNTLPFGTQLTSVTLTSEEKAHYFHIEYKRFESRLLPPPYVTRCKDYTIEGYKSRLHAMEECCNILSLREFGSNFKSNVVNSNSDDMLSLLSFDVEYENPEIRLIINNIYHNCTSATHQPDCSQVYYIPRMQKKARLDSNQSMVYITMPTEPDIVNRFHEKLPFIEYIIYIGSTMGFWLGFNVMNSIPDAIKYFAELLLHQEESKRIKRPGKIFDRYEKNIQQFYRVKKPYIKY